MKKIKDVILEELDNRDSGHTPKRSINGPNTCCSPNPMRGSHNIGDRILARLPNKSFKGGFITGMLTVDNETTYTVTLHGYHGGHVIETKEVL